MEIYIVQHWRIITGNPAEIDSGPVLAVFDDLELARAYAAAQRHSLSPENRNPAELGIATEGYSIVVHWLNALTATR